MLTAHRQESAYAQPASVRKRQPLRAHNLCEHNNIACVQFKGRQANYELTTTNQQRRTSNVERPRITFLYTPRPARE